MTEREIFFEALEITTPEARAAYLQEACGRDVNLRRQVEELLKEHLSNDSLLAGPALDGERPVTVEAPVEEAPAQMIGRYKLLEKLGEGGFGEVWMAEQREPVKRRVALKIIKLGMDSRQIVARFEAERQALAMMDHANIAKIFDADVTDSGRPYFVMELVRGIKITEYCDQNQLPTRERLDLFIKVCQAIQHAHQKGIIHRDIKPSNILVTLHDGVPVPKVIDFGIAKATQGELTDKTVFTQFQQFIGTPAYISPEQAEMSGLDIDTRADIYSLGVLLYELLVGQTPFDAKEMMQGGLDALRQIIREKEPLRPSTRLAMLAGEELTTTAKRRSSDTSKLLHQLKGDLDWIVMKCLEKDRTRRYETANGLAADIKRHLSNEPIVARPPSATYRIQKAWERNKVVFTAGAAVFLALAAGLTLAALGWIQTRTQRDVAVLAQAGEETHRKQAQANEKRAIQERQGAEFAREETRRRAYAAEITVAFQAIAENNLKRALELLDRQRPKKPGDVDLRGFEWRHLWQLCQSDAKASFGGAWAHHPAFSPDGRWLANGGDRIVIHELPSQAVVKTIPIAATTPAFSPDGKLLASGHDSHVSLWSTESWKEKHRLPDARYPSVFSRDGQWLVTGAVGGYRVWNTRTWQPATPSFCAGEPWPDYLWQSCYGVAFSPDGRLLVTAGHPGGHEAGQFQVWDFPSLTVRTNFSSPPSEFRSAVFTPDSKYLLTGDQFGRLLVWDVDKGRVVDIRPEHTSGISTITFSRDGRTMATSSYDRTLAVWDWETRKVLVRLRGHLGQIESAAISPDGRMLASGSSEGTIMLWDTSTRHERRMLPGCGVIAGFSANSRRLVVRGYKDFRLWPLEDGAATKIPLDNYVHRRLTAWGDVHGIEPYAVFGMTNGFLEHWNLATMSRIASWRVSKTGVCSTAFAPDGKVIAISDVDGILKLWEATTHREIRQFDALEKLECMIFSPDGQLLAGMIDNDNPRVCIWDVNEGRMLCELKYDRPRPSLSFSPDGKLLATGHMNNTARLWEIPSGKFKATLPGHIATVNGVAFSPDGKTLATGSYDRKVKLWNITTEQELVTLELLPGSCLSLRFSPDGRTLAAGSFLNLEPYISLWQAPSFDEIYAVEAKQKRESDQP